MSILQTLLKGREEVGETLHLRGALLQGLIRVMTTQRLSSLMETAVFLLDSYESRRALSTCKKCESELVSLCPSCPSLLLLNFAVQSKSPEQSSSVAAPSKHQELSVKPGRQSKNRTSSQLPKRPIGSKEVKVEAVRKSEVCTCDDGNDNGDGLVDPPSAVDNLDPPSSLALQGHSEPVPVSDVPSAVPERTSHPAECEHDYASSSSLSFAAGLQLCLPALRLLAWHESELMTHNLIGMGPKRFLCSTESHMRALCKSRAFEGAMYMTLFKQGSTYFARVIESGCFRGVVKSSGFQCALCQAVPGMTRPLMYHVFSPADLQQRGVKRKRKGTDNIPERGDKTFKRSRQYLEKDLETLKAEVEHDADTCLLGVVVYTLRRSKKHIKFFRGRFKEGSNFCPSPHMEAVLENFAKNKDTSSPTPLTHIPDLSPEADLQKQLDALASLDHSAENIPNVRGQGVVTGKGHTFPFAFVSCESLFMRITMQPGTLPRTFRPRLCHFLLAGQKGRVRQILASRSTLL